MRMFLLTLFLITFSSITSASITWETPKKITSKVLQEPRDYRVSLPIDYNENTDKQYSLLLILDGQFYGDLVANNALFLSDAGDIPYHVVVALDSTNRLRDFTPTDSDDWVGDGGADKFLHFVTQELLPELQGLYRIEKHKVIWGHSAAGLYVMHHMMSAPNSFDAYLVNDGSLDWDNKVIEKELSQYLQRSDRPRQFLYFNNSYLIQDMPDEVRFIAPLKDILRNNAGEKLRWVHQNLDNESHGSIPLIGSINGLRALYEGYRIPESVVFSGLDGLISYFERVKHHIGAPNQIPENSILDLAFHQLWTKPATSVATFEYCLELYPESLSALEGLSEAYLNQGDFSRGLKTLETAIQKAQKTDSEKAVELQKKLGQLKLEQDL
ncbi:alpha/beta hydrolase-fold protein [Glaciecola sp. 1036]|uniref:alpha/beta hydrolase n=1 Tax=Alteromonadaceae TaxID=72275 RepID=UPI003D07A261